MTIRSRLASLAPVLLVLAAGCGRDASVNAWLSQDQVRRAVDYDYGVAAIDHLRGDGA